MQSEERCIYPCGGSRTIPTTRDGGENYCIGCYPEVYYVLGDHYTCILFEVRYLVSFCEYNHEHVYTCVKTFFLLCHIAIRVVWHLGRFSLDIENLCHR